MAAVANMDAFEVECDRFTAVFGDARGGSLDVRSDPDEPQPELFLPRRSGAIEAMCWSGSDESTERLLAWGSQHDIGMRLRDYGPSRGGQCLNVETSRGFRALRPGDWLTRDSDGEFSILTEGQMHAQYTAVNLGPF